MSCVVPPAVPGSMALCYLVAVEELQLYGGMFRQRFALTMKHYVEPNYDIRLCPEAQLLQLFFAAKCQ